MRNFFSIILFVLFLGLVPEIYAKDWLGEVSISELQKKTKLSIVLAGENLDSPASMFGHTFLVAYDGDYPKPNDIVIEYLADTSDNQYDTISALLYKVPGKFSLSRYFFKIKQNDLEDRDLIVYDVDMSSIQISNVIQKIKTFSPAENQYNFISRNCSYYLLNLLIDNDSRRLITVPLRTIETLKKKSLIKFSRYVPSTLKKLEGMYGQLSTNNRQTIQNVLSGQSCLAPCLDKHEFENTLGLALNYRIPREASLSLRNHLTQEKKKYTYIEKESSMIPQKGEVDPTNEMKISSLQFLYNTNGAMVLNFSPIYKTYFGVNSRPMDSSTVESFRTQIAVSQSILKVTEFNLFKMEAMIPGGYFSKGIVRYVDLSYYDWSVFHYGKNEAVARVGYGLTHKLFNNFQISFIPYVGGRFYDLPNERLGMFDSGIRFYLIYSIFDNFHIRLIHNYDFSDKLGFNQRIQLESLFFINKAMSLVFNVTSVNDIQQSVSTNLGLSFYY